MVIKMYCFKDKDIKHELILVLFLIGFLVPTIYISNYTTKFVEIPFKIGFNTELFSNNITCNGCNINNKSFGINYSIENFEFVFTNIASTYSKKELNDAVVEKNSTNPAITNIINNLSFLTRSFYLYNIKTPEELGETILNFKIPKEYRVLYMSLTLSFVNGKNLKFYVFFDSNSSSISSMKVYEFTIERLINTLNNDNFVYVLNIRNANFFELYDITYR